MASNTAQRPTVGLQLRAAFAPATYDASSRSVELTWSTGADVPRSGWDGDFFERLSLATGAVRLERLNSGAPLLDAHNSMELRNVIGVVERAWLAGNQGHAVVRFSDRPEIEPIVQDVKNGILRNISVGYKVHRWEITPPSDSVGVEIRTAVDWEPYELSLVPIPADAGAQVRSEQNNQTENTTMANAIANDQQTNDLPLDRRERQRCAAILDATRKASLDSEFAEQLIADGTPEADARAAILDAMYERQQQQPKTHARIDVSPASGNPTPLKRGIEAALQHDEPLDLPELLRYEGVRGRTPLERVQNAMLGRGMTSTTDLPALLLGGMEGRMLQRFTMQQGGILEAASIDTIPDFRPFSVMDSGLVGVAKKLKEGGEIPYTAINESAKTAKAGRVALAVAISVEALANDARGGLIQAVDELGMAPLDAEKVDLVYELEGTANGGTCADGKALFDASHANSVNAGPIGIDKLGAAIALLRGQKSIGGRFIDQKPATIICGTAAELTLRQLLSDTLVASEPQNVNPWRDLQIEVEPRLGDTYCYLLSAGPRRPLELGRLYAAPRLSSTVDFETSAYKVKCEHAYSVAVTEFRAIVRMKLAA